MKVGIDAIAVCGFWRCRAIANVPLTIAQVGRAIIESDLFTVFGSYNPTSTFELNQRDRPQPHSPQYHLIESKTTVCTQHGFCDRLSNPGVLHFCVGYWDGEWGRSPFHR